jgi:hypothetical protein
MIWRPQWTVLVPGKPALLEERAREILEDFDEGNDYTFTVIPGQGRYHAVVETGSRQTELEAVLGDAFSREVSEPVYSIEGREEEPYISCFVGGKETPVDQEPEDLVRSLGCTVPWFDEPPLPPYKPQTRHVALIQGVSAEKVRKTLETRRVLPLQPGAYRLEENPLGVLLADGLKPIGSSANYLSSRFQRATIYSIIASPDLENFSVMVMKGQTTNEFLPPPRVSTFFPAVHEIMGERTPEAILAAMGIPKEWFKL